MTRQFVLTALVLWLSACGEPEAERRRGVVARVIDGDTVELQDGTVVRYLIADTPELNRGDCFAVEARDYNVMLVLGQEVELELDEEPKDRFGRTLAYVYVGEVMMSRALVEQGYARTLVIKPNVRYAAELQALEADAKARGAGMWGVCD